MNTTLSRRPCPARACVGRLARLETLMKTRIVFCVLNTMYPHEYKTLASPVSSPRLARSRTRARAHRSPSRAASRARPTPDLERGDARARFASTRTDARIDRPNLAKTSKSRFDDARAYLSKTNGRRSIRCALESRDSSDARRRVVTTRDGGNHRDGVGGAASRRRTGRVRWMTRDGRRRARRRELEASSGRERTKRRRRGGVEGR